MKNLLVVSETNFVNFIAIIVILMLLVLFSLFTYLIYKYYQKQQESKLALKNLEVIHKKELLNMQSEITKQVLKTIGMELHDDVSHHLVMLKLEAESGKIDYNKGSSELSDRLGNVIKTLQGITSFFSTLDNDFLDVINNIEEDINRINKKGLLKITYVNQNPETPENLLSRLYIFRIYQEVITNVYRHSQAKEMEIKLLSDKNNFIMVMNDFGKGFETSLLNYSKDSLGLNNIKNRCNSVGGSFEIISKLGHGTNITIKIPLI